jgi:hypothetical protein
MSACSRMLRLTASSIAYPPATHQGPSNAEKIELTSVTLAGCQGPHHVSPVATMINPRKGR